MQKMLVTLSLCFSALTFFVVSGEINSCATCGNGLLSRFGMEQGYTNFNHGSYGCVPTDVMQHHYGLLQRVESNPDKWFRTDYRPLQASNRIRLANYVDADEEDLVFVENASAGCNAFLRSFGAKLAQGTKILHLSCAYGMVKALLSLLVDEQDVELVQVELDATDFSSSALVLAKIKQTIDAHGGAEAFSLGVISHISSVPAIILPIEGFVELLPGVPVFIDGAHVPGQMKLNLNDLRSRHANATIRSIKAKGNSTATATAATSGSNAAGAVAYTGNLHKWMYTPKGVAFLWASPEFQNLIDPPTISNRNTNFVTRFAYTGTRDYTPFCSTGAGFDFRDSLGTEAEVLSYGHTLALWAGEHLSAVWGSEVMQDEAMTGWMTNIRLPSDDSAKIQEMATRLLEDYNTRVVVYGWPAADGSTTQWTRLSAQVYLQKSNFEELGRLVLDLLKEIDEEITKCGFAGCSRHRMPASASSSSEHRLQVGILF